MEIDPQLVKKLREKTNAGMMDCKRALTDAGGNFDRAEQILREKGIASASKKASRATKEGIVAAYIHQQGKVGVLVEVNCETDFVAKNQNFRDFVKDITLHIAAAHPLYVSREQVPGNLIEAEREIYKAQVKGKPANVVDKIVDGKLDKFYSTVCLLEQGFIKNPEQTIGDLLKAKIAELGENIVIRRFTRYLSYSPKPLRKDREQPLSLSIGQNALSCIRLRYRTAERNRRCLDPTITREIDHPAQQ